MQRTARKLDRALNWNASENTVLSVVYLKEPLIYTEYWRTKLARQSFEKCVWFQFELKIPKREKKQIQRSKWNAGTTAVISVYLNRYFNRKRTCFFSFHGKMQTASAEHL